MHDYVFTVWAVMMSIGIALSAYFTLPLSLVLVGLVAAACMLCAFHRRKNNLNFGIASCVFFLLLGYARSEMGDWHLVPVGVEAWGSALSQAALARLHSLGLPADVSALLDAMLLGQRGELSLELKHLYADVGASHVLALSGLHLGILFGLLNFWMMRLLPHRLLRYAIGSVSLILIWGYALLTGFSPSLTRAAVMVSLLLLSQMRLCGTDGWHALGLAATAILLVSPSSLWTVGFQLSFASVAGIFLFYKPLEGMVNVRNRWLRWLWMGMCASLAAQMGSLPLIAFYFHQVSVYSVLFSPLYILLASLILYAALLTLVLGKCMVAVMSFLVFVQHGLMRLTAMLPMSVAEGLYPSLAALILNYGCVLLLAYALNAQSQRTIGARHERLANFFRQWPYLVAGIMCLLMARIAG